jgi:hypothetical protein
MRLLTQHVRHPVSGDRIEEVFEVDTEEVSIGPMLMERRHMSAAAVVEEVGWQLDFGGKFEECIPPPIAFRVRDEDVFTARSIAFLEIFEHRSWRPYPGSQAQPSPTVERQSRPARSPE